MSILDLPLEPNHYTKRGTIREYFRDMMVQLWIQGESFSGKRPLGNSGWEEPVYVALVKGGVVEGAVDEDGYLNYHDRGFDRAKADQLVTEALQEM